MAEEKKEEVIKPNVIDEINIFDEQPIGVSENVASSPVLPITKKENKGRDILDLKELRIGAGDNSFNANYQGIFLGSEQFTTGVFRVSMAGALTATSATITGTITATAGTIGGFTISATTISATNLTLTSGVANTANITVGTGATAAGLNSANAAGDIAIWAGSTFANRATAPFRVEADGDVIATSITATGTINATGGYIGTTTALVYESQGINCGTTGWLRGGMTDYNTGTGWFIGYNSSAYKLSIGNSSDTSKLLLWNGTDLIVNDSVISRQDIFGDGSDGDLTTSGNVTLTVDTYYGNLTVSTGHILDCAGFRLFVKGTLTVNGTLQRTPNAGGNGGNYGADYLTPGAAGAAGAALADGSLKGGLAGKVGVIGAIGIGITTDDSKGNGTAGTNNSNTGADVAKSLVGYDGVAGVAGNTSGNATMPTPGTATGGSGGTGAAGGTRTGTIYNKVRSVMSAYLLYDTLPTADNLKSAPSNGGCGSSGSGAAATGTGSDAFSGCSGGSGGGGSQGGIVTIFAKKIVVGAAGIIRANGGAGGNGGMSRDANCPGAGNCAIGGTSGSPSGDGGNGGVLILCYSSLTNAGTIEAAGGVGGTGGVAGAKYEGGGGTATDGVTGTTGTTGNAGNVIYLTS